MAKKIDFKAAASKMAGHAAGGFVYTQLNKLKFMQQQTNPKVKGLLAAGIGYIVIPMLAEKLKLSGRGSKADLFQHVGEGVGIVGVMQLANSVKPGLVPAISGYEENPIGLLTEEDGYGVSGYEENPIGATNEEVTY